MISKFILLYAISGFSVDTWILVLISAIGDYLFDLYKSNIFYDKCWTKKTYDEVTFKGKFEKEKFVNIDIYMREVYELMAKINKNYSGI